MENLDIKHETPENINKLSTSGVDYNENLKIISQYEEKGKVIKKKDEEEAEFLLVDDISEEEFNDLCIKNQLTDDEVRKIVKYSNNKEPGIVLFLTSISVEQAKILSKAKDFIELSKLESISDEAVEELSKQGRSICLPNLKSITDSQSKSLSKVKSVQLGGLESITDSQVKELANVAIMVYLPRKILTPTQKRILRKHGYDFPD